MPVLISATEDDAFVIVFATCVMAPCRPDVRNWVNGPSARSARPLGNCPPMADSWSATSPTLRAWPWSCAGSTSNCVMGDLRWVVGPVVVTVVDHRCAGRQVLLDHVQRGARTEALGRDAGHLGTDRVPRPPRGVQDEPGQLSGFEPAGRRREGEMRQRAGCADGHRDLAAGRGRRLADLPQAGAGLVGARRDVVEPLVILREPLFRFHRVPFWRSWPYCRVRGGYPSAATG